MAEWLPWIGRGCQPDNALGYDWHLKSNTSKRRTHSLFRQGSMLYELTPTMPDHRLRPLVEQFAHMLAAQPVFREMFDAV